MYSCGLSRWGSSWWRRLPAAPGIRYGSSTCRSRVTPWTFYGRSYRAISPERVVEDLASIREPGVFIVDDVALAVAVGASDLEEADHTPYRGTHYEYKGDKSAK
jgi:hypothetical protein